VVLVDFWTYTCINCIRTLPYLRSWHEKYADKGLVILGVHTPEFEFEKLYDNVVEATKDEGVVWPVVQDNEFSVWRSYSNRYWPAKYLIDQTGEVRYTHFGEGKYAETEEWIRTLLLEAGMTATIDLPLPEDQGRDETFMRQGRDITRELFAGWKFTASQGRGGIGQGEEYLEAARASLSSEGEAGVTAQFSAPESLERNLIYFNGPWAISPESARHAEETTHFDDYLALMYSARSVNAVLTSDSGEPYQVRVTLNGEYLTDENKGDDIVIDGDGVSYLQVTDPKLYKIIEHSTWQGGQVLKMASMSDDFGLYSFTFGVYEDGY
jgi:thiol-disulfide isomerase/thioredoxin